MAEHYTNSISRSKRRKRKSYSGRELTLLLLDTVTTVAMPMLLFCSLTVIICQYISPEKSGILSVIALGAPIIYLLDIIVMFYWVVRWRWYRALTMIFIVLLGLFYHSRYYKIEFDRKYDTKVVEHRFTKIMTYNVRDGKAEGLTEYIKNHNPDILCLQDMTIGSDNWNALSDIYKTTYAAKVGAGGSQILSKFRIIRSGRVDSLERKSSVWADLKVKDDTIRVVNLHLQSTSISAEDTQFIEKHEYIHDNDRKGKLSSIISRLVENNRKRAVQAEIVADFLKKSPYKTIVCGDFNDVPISYTYNRIARKLNDAFSMAASGLAYTYDTKYPLLRIDNILVSPAITISSYEVDNEARFSDHYPVISRVKFN